MSEALANDRPLRIMLVERSTVANYAVQKLFEELGCEVHAFGSPTEALERAPAIAPHAIYTGIALSGMTGYELCRQLRQIPATKNTVVVALTRMSFPGIKSIMRQAGFDYHLHKPVRLDALMKTVVILADGHDGKLS